MPKFNKVKPYNSEAKLLKSEPDYFPSLRLTSKDFPAIEKWKLGDYYVVAKVSLSEKSQRDKDGEEKRTSGELEFKEIAEITKEQVDSLD